MIIDITIKGTSPLLMNRMSEEAALQATQGSRGSSAAADRLSPEDDARSRLHTDEEGIVVMPSKNLLNCFKWGGRSFKIGTRTITTRDHSMIPGVLTFFEAAYPILSEGGWHVDAQPVSIPATGGKILRYRPIFMDWAIEFSVDLDTEEINEPLFRQIVDKSAKMSGLGDYRPSAGGGPYGKFQVEAWVPHVEELPTTKDEPRKRRGRPRRPSGEPVGPDGHADDELAAD